MGNTAVTTMRVGSQNVATPGARSQVKQVSEQAPALAANGVLAIVGPARNGAPQSVLEFDNLEGVQQYLSLVDLDGSIGLRLAAELACNASDDEAVAGQPARLVLVKTNRDTRGVATIYSGAGPLFAVRSKDYGAHVNKTNIAVATGSQKGVRITIKDGLGGTPEFGDNLGGDSAASILYDGEADAAVVTIDADGFRAAWQKALSGLNGALSEVKNGWDGTVVHCKSSSTKDTYQRVTVYGLDGDDAPVSETFLLNGTTVVATTTEFAKLTGAKIDGAHVGTVKLASSGGVDFDTDTFISFAANATDALASSATLKVESNSGADQGKQVEIVGYDSTANIAQGTGLVSEIVTLGAADSPVTTTRIFSKVLRARWLSSVDPDGTVVIYPTGGSAGSPHLTIDDTHLSPGYNHTRGLHVVQTIPQAGVITLDGATPSGDVSLVLRGKNAAGEDVVEFLSTAEQETAAEFAVLEHIELGAVPSTTSVSLSGTMLNLPATETVEDLVTVAGQFSEFTVLGFALDRKLSELDQIDAVDITVALNLYASAWDVIDWINETSQLLEAEAIGSPNGLPSVTGAPIYLSGGTTATTTVQDYLDALELLKTVDDINHVVCLTTNTAVHAALRDHCDWWFLNKPGGRQGYVGLQASTKDEIKSQTVLLNENMLSWAQTVPRYDSSGVLRTYGSIVGAVLIAGMKASSPTGEPLTWKYMKTEGDVGQTGWDPAIDSEEMLRSGLCFAENVKGRGVRIVRSITCYQKRPDPNRTQLSSWESLLASKGDLTTYLAEVTTGKRRSRLTDASVAQLANKRLDDQVAAGMIEAHTFPQVKRIANGQGKAVSVGVTPEQPNDFTLLTLNL